MLVVRFRRLLCFLLFFRFSNASSSKLPNIVVLLADNLGYNDISLFGAATAKTPNIDRLGHEGIKLNHWNSAAHLCSASRAALLTGLYPAKLGVYPRVFHPDAVLGLGSDQKTLANHLKKLDYATSIVGKWHLGHRPEYLPTRHHGFDQWIGVPYHMSGGSIDQHVCYNDANQTMWLPLYANETIVEQPVRVDRLAERFAQAAVDFIHQNKKEEKPYFLYMAFSHVHQLCASADKGASQCQWGKEKENTTFVDAVEEMDWIAGKILDAIDASGDKDNTFVLFTSDNGPWVAEQECAGSKGPFEGRWLMENVDISCTACPSGFISKPTPDEPRQCILPDTTTVSTGVHCGADTGLGSVWEANLRMPALIRWPDGGIMPATETMEMVSTLDVVPTVLSVVGLPIPDHLDGMDLTPVLLGQQSKKERVLFFWRDGFSTGPLPSPYGRHDVAAVKWGRIKAWFYTKSAHYNDDLEQFHDPPLLFDVLDDPAEAFPLDPNKHLDTIERIKRLTQLHKASIPDTFPLTLPTDPKFLPCVDWAANCRTHNQEASKTEAMIIAE